MPMLNSFFCETCGCEIIARGDFGRVERESVTVGFGGACRVTRKIYICRGCVEEEEREFQAWTRSPEAEIEAAFCCADYEQKGI